MADEIKSVDEYVRWVFATPPGALEAAACHHRLLALLDVLRDRLGDAVEAGDAVPFGVLDPRPFSLIILPSLSRFGREVARLKLVILVPPWVEGVSGALPTLPARMTRFFMTRILLFAGGSSPRLNTVKGGQDGGSTGARRGSGEPRSEEWCGQPRSGNSVRTTIGLGPLVGRLWSFRKERGWTSTGDKRANRVRILDLDATTSATPDALHRRHRRQLAP